jgi:hypothetical protein
MIGPKRYPFASSVGRIVSRLACFFGGIVDGFPGVLGRALLAGCQSAR